MKYLVFLFFELFYIVSVDCSNPLEWKGSSEQIYSDDYMVLQRGVYYPKSTDSVFVASTRTQIEGNTFIDTSFLELGNLKYLANETPIALFTKMGDVTKSDVAGILCQSTLVTVDSIYYKKVYIDSEDAPMTFQEWSDLTEQIDNYFFKYPLFYEVWYSININGEKYYTDYKLHDLIEYKLYMPSKKQLLLLCSQSTGYDGGYDLGYPDYYVIVVLEETKQGWAQIYRSERLDLNNGGMDEYGLCEVYPIEVSNNGSKIDINFADLFRITWTGKKAIVDILQND